MINKKQLEDYIVRLEHIEEVAEDIDNTAYHLRLELEKELKNLKEKK